MWLLCAAVGALMAGVSAAQDVTLEQALEAASDGRVVRIALPDRAVTELPLELYVARVLAGEGEPRAPEAAQQALAIAIRTFTFANRRRHARDGADLCTTTHCQVLRASSAVSRRATLATVGRVLLYAGRPADVFYSASCGGHTEAASAVWPRATFPYLPGTPDDVHANDVDWTIDFTLERLRAALLRAGFRGERLRGLRIDERSVSGRVTRLRLDGLLPEALSGDRLRHVLGPAVLRSAAFDVVMEGDTVRFTGRGYGHGVGLCVVGAGRRAARGESADAILRTYFPGVTIGHVY